MFDLATGEFIPDQSAPITPTAAPASMLDTGGGGLWDTVNGSLSKLLDVYTTVEVARVQANQLPQAGTPAGYFRVPGTGQVVPAGTAAGASGGFNTMTMLMIGGGLLLLALVFMPKKA